MAKYTYKDVIIDPNDPRVEIGKTYYAATSISSTLRAANAENESFLVKLDSVNREPTRTIITAKPFTVSYKQGNGGDTDFIIRKKESSYDERQAEWVKANDIKAGDKVRVLKGFVGNSKDIPYGITSEMENLIGKTLEVRGVYKNCIKVLDGHNLCCWAWPYYCLEKVEEPEFKVGDFVRTEYESIGVITEIIAHDFVVIRTNNLSYFNLSKSRLEHIKAHLKPFDLEDKDTRDKIRGCWIRKKDNSEIKLIWGLWELDGKWMIGEGSNPQELLNDWVFEDGSPCGIVVEDE